MSLGFASIILKVSEIQAVILRLVIPDDLLLVAFAGRVGLGFSAEATGGESNSARYGKSDQTFIQ